MIEPEGTATERTRTTYNGAVEGSYTSLPFGDSYAATGTDEDPYHFAALDHDYESETDHAQFRQYSNEQGRWHAPDPYYGSYDFSNPQSLNRYSYALNNPLSMTDGLGLFTQPPPIDPDGPIIFCEGGSGLVDCWEENAGPDDCNLGDNAEFEEGCQTEWGAAPADPHGSGGGASGAATQNSTNTSTCTISNGRTTAPGPGQATGPGAFGLYPSQYPGMVAIDPWALGLPPGLTTNNQLGPYASQITFSFSPTPNLPAGFPTTFTLGDIAGGTPNPRLGHSGFDGNFDFDIYALPTLADALAASSEPVTVTVSYPSSLPIDCNGPALDPPIQSPLPSPPGPVSAVRGRIQ